MIKRFGMFVLLLPFLCVAGCGEAPQPKTSDPVEIEKNRQLDQERSNREQSTSR